MHVGTMRQVPCRRLLCGYHTARQFDLLVCVLISGVEQQDAQMTNRAISPRFAIRIEVNGLIVVIAVVAIVEEYRYLKCLEARVWRARFVRDEWACMIMGSLR